MPEPNLLAIRIQHIVVRSECQVSAKSSKHGEVKAYWKGNILVVKPMNTFNLDGMIAAVNEVKKVVDQHPPGKWARVVMFSDENVVGPVDGAKYIVESFQYSRERGCSVICLIGGNAINKEGLSRVCAAVDLPLYQFSNLDEVEKFVSSLDEMTML